jgi:hypothetical protein
MSEYDKKVIDNLAIPILGSGLEEYDNMERMFEEVKVSQKNTLSEVLSKFWDKYPHLASLKELSVDLRYAIQLNSFNLYIVMTEA